MDNILGEQTFDPGMDTPVCYVAAPERLETTCLLGRAALTQTTG